MDINNLYNEIKEKVLSFNEILNIGINDEDLEWDLVNWIALDSKSAERYEDMKKFTGLVYYLDDNGNIEGYREYKDGLEDGFDIDFYPNGNIKAYGVNIKRCMMGLYCEFDENKNCILAEIHTKDDKETIYNIKNNCN